MINEIMKRLGRGEKVELECIDLDGFSKRYSANDEILAVGMLIVERVIDGYIKIEKAVSRITPSELKYFRIKEQDKEREMNTKQQYDFKALVHFSEKAVKDGVLKETVFENCILRAVTHKNDNLYSCFDQAISDFMGRCMDSLKQEYKKQGVEFDDLKVKMNGVALADLGKPDFNELIDVAVKAYKDKVLPKVDLHNGEISLTGLGAINENRGSDVFQSAINDIQALYTEAFTIESEDDVKRINWQEADTVLSNGEPFPLYVLYGYSEDISIKAILCILKGATIKQKRGK